MLALSILDLGLLCTTPRPIYFQSQPICYDCPREPITCVPWLVLPTSLYQAAIHYLHQSIYTVQVKVQHSLLRQMNPIDSNHISMYLVSLLCKCSWAPAMTEQRLQV